VATNTTAHAANPIHTHTRAKLVIAPAWATVPTAKLLAEHIPRGNTVDQRPAQRRSQIEHDVVARL
jgi:hypothetical protein